MEFQCCINVILETFPPVLGENNNVMENTGMHHTVVGKNHWETAAEQPAATVDKESYQKLVFSCVLRWLWELTAQFGKLLHPRFLVLDNLLP